MSETGSQGFSGVFIMAFIALGVGNVALLFLSKNARVKRRVFPWIMLLSGAVFLVPVFEMMANSQQPPVFRIFFVLIVGVVCFLNIRMTKFCDSCGATILNSGGWFTTIRYCSRCGAKLRDSQ